jgi:hypothetical protein
MCNKDVNSEKGQWGERVCVIQNTPSQQDTENAYFVRIYTRTAKYNNVNIEPN